MTANLEEIVQWLDNAGLLCWEWKSGRKRAVMAVEFSEREAEGNGAWVAVLRAYSHGPKPDRVTAIEHPVSREYFNAHMVYEGNTGCRITGGEPPEINGARPGLEWQAGKTKMKRRYSWIQKIAIPAAGRMVMAAMAMNTRRPLESRSGSWRQTVLTAVNRPARKRFAGRT